MTPEEFHRAVALIDGAFASLANAPGQGTAAAINASLWDGKIYELHVLAWLLPQFSASGFDVRVENGPHLLLKSKPGFVDRSEPYLSLSRDGVPEFEVWCNVQFVGLGFLHALAARDGLAPLSPDYHEIDIAITCHGVADGYLLAPQVAVAIECKDRALEKRMLREALGLRRELSYMGTQRAPGNQFPFNNRPPVTTQRPPSRIFLCSSSSIPRDYDQICPAYAVHVEHVPA